MGMAKASLPFGPETLVERAVRIACVATGRVIVVAAAGQALPRFPSGVRVVHDTREGRGPLEGMLAGLTAAADDGSAAFVTSCDAPLMLPAFIERMASLLGDHDIAVPLVLGRYHPLAAVYRTRVLAHIEDLLAQDQLRPTFLFDRVPTRSVAAEELRDVDPALASLRNLNRPEDYLAALAEAGFTAPPDVMRALALE